MKIRLFDNLTLKLIALALAIVIWFLIAGEKRSEVRLTVPLEMRNLPTTWEILESVSQVEVAIRGFSSVIKKLTPNDIDVYIDLSNVVAGMNSFLITPDDIVTPVGVSVIQVSPSDISVAVDATTQKAIPVEPVVRGNPAEGYLLSSLSVEPKTVTVTGAQSLLKSLVKVETETVAIDNADKTVSKKVKIRLPHPNFRIEHDDEKTVTVNAQILPEMMERVFEDIPVQGEKVDTRTVTFSPKTVTLLVQGPKTVLSQLLLTDIAVFIDTRAFPAGQSSVQPTFKLPEFLNVKTYYPKMITVNILAQ